MELSMKSRSLNQRGFTLVELLIVIAITAVLIAGAVYFANRYLPVYRLREATRDMASTLQQARLEAIRRSANCVVSFSTAVNGTLFDYISFVDDDQDFQFDPGETLLSSVQLANYQYVF